MTLSNSTRILAALVATIAMSACGGGTTSGNDDTIVDEPPEVTINPNIVATTVTRLGAANAVPIPPTPATGAATYAGGMLADATINGAGGQKIFANIDASANLFNGTFSGTMRNFNLVDASNTPTEGIQGALNFNGSSNGVSKTVTATADGNLVGNFGGDTRETVNMSIGMDGRVRGPNIFDNMSTLNGDISGGSTAGQPVTVRLDGEFYLRDDL